MTTLHVIVGDVTTELAKYALRLDSSAYLVDSSNISQTHIGTVYTSLGDVHGEKHLLSLLSTATEITYRPPKIWSDKKTSSDKYSMAWYTEHYVNIVSALFYIKVNGLELPLYRTLPIEQARVTDTPQLWVAGCSTTFGVGVTQSERYANVLSKRLNLSASVLAQSAASNVWVADQILRSDIRRGDLVVFGITSYQRFTLSRDQSICQIGVHNFVKEKNLRFPELDILQLDSETRIYESLRSLDQVVNFCNKVDAKLIMIGIHANLELSTALSKYKNFVFCHGKFGEGFRDGWLDIGNDADQHPGPKTHEMYADMIISKAKQLDFI